MASFEDELKTGREIARRAGELALTYRKKGIDYDAKSDDSPVTIADRECEKLIATELQKAFPADGMLGEEGALRESTNGRKWIVDPIDGTRDFIRGTGAWSVLIGLEQADHIVAGFAFFPESGAMYYAARGLGAWREINGAAEQIRVSSVSRLNEALVCVNGLSFMHRYPFAGSLLDWLAGAWTVRSMGGCLDAALVASGIADVWIEAQAKPWDLAPLKVIAEEAGARTFDFEGRDTIYGGNFVITVPPLADELRRFVGRKESE